MISRRAMMNDEIVSKSGELLQLEKCKGSYLDGLRVFGKSTQVKTTGAQLFSGGAFKFTVKSSDSGYGDAPDVVTDAIKQLPNGEYYAAYTPKGNGTIGNVAGKISFLDSAGEAFVNKVNTFTMTDEVRGKIAKVALYGYLNQENSVNDFMVNTGTTAKPYEPYTGGKPSPSIEYPQDIESVGDDREIGMSVTGINVMKPTRFTWNSEYKFASSKKFVDELLPGVIKPNASYTFVIEKEFQHLFETVRFMDLDATNKNSDTARFYDKNYAVIKTNIKLEPTDKNALYFKMTKIFSDEEAEAITNMKAMMLLGDWSGKEIPDIEEYHEQFVTLTTPNGLQGIPVSKDGNYTDENGQQWVCDEIDLGKGKYVQRVLSFKILDTDDMSEYTANGTNEKYLGIQISNEYSNLTDNMWNHKQQCAILSNRFIGAYGEELVWNFMKEGISANNNTFLISIRKEICPTINDFKKYLQNNPVNGIVKLKTPIETDLTPEEIAAYKSLHTYAGTTVVMNDADVGMEVSYRKVRG